MEAGALLGGSALLLEETAASVVSIDRHEGYGLSTLRPYLSNLSRFSKGRIDARIGDAIEELPRVVADVALIDLTGAEALTAAALKAVRAPLVAVHDFGRQRCAGVERAIGRSDFRIIHIVDTLAILERTR